MSKFSKLSSEYVEIFDELLKNYPTISQCVKIDLLASEKVKTVYSVFKANDMVNFYSDNEVIIVFNEELLDVLDEKGRQFYIEEALAYINFNIEKGTISLVKPDISATFSGLIKKYGIDEFIRFNELMNLVLQQKEDKIEEEKRQKKEKSKQDREAKKH